MKLRLLAEHALEACYPTPRRSKPRSASIRCARNRSATLALPGFAPSRWLCQTLRAAQFTVFAFVAMAATVPAQAADKKPNILIIWGDDIGIANISAYSGGVMGYTTPNIDRIAREGLRLQHYYGEQSGTTGCHPSLHAANDPDSHDRPTAPGFGSYRPETNA